LYGYAPSAGKILSFLPHIWGGVLERFPELKTVSAENDVGWMRHFMYRMDHAYEKFGTLAPEPLPMRPSEYIKRQV
jgi:uncharacterized protein